LISEFCALIFAKQTHFLSINFMATGRLSFGVKMNGNLLYASHLALSRQAWSFLLAKTLRRSADCAHPSRSAGRKETLWK
jgi:hypothetical protein